MPFIFSKGFIVLYIFMLFSNDSIIIREGIMEHTDKQKNSFFRPKTSYELEINIEHEDATNERLLLPAFTNRFCQLKLCINYQNQHLRTKFKTKGKQVYTIFQEIEAYFRQHYPTLNLSVDHIRIITPPN